jgi:hypothetical protein
LAHRDKSNAEILRSVSDKNRTSVDKGSRPNLSRLTRRRH